MHMHMTCTLWCFVHMLASNHMLISNHMHICGDMCMWCFACVLCYPHATLDRVCTASAEGDRRAEDFGGEDRGAGDKGREAKAAGPLRSPPRHQLYVTISQRAHGPHNPKGMACKAQNLIIILAINLLYNFLASPPSCLYPDRAPYTPSPVPVHATASI